MITDLKQIRYVWCNEILYFSLIVDVYCDHTTNRLPHRVPRTLCTDARGGRAINISLFVGTLQLTRVDVTCIRETRVTFVPGGENVLGASARFMRTITRWPDVSTGIPPEYLCPFPGPVRRRRSVFVVTGFNRQSPYDMMCMRVSARPSPVPGGRGIGCR